MALSGAQGVTLSVRLSGTSLSKALKLHLFSQRSVSDLSKVSLGSSSGHPQVSLRSVSGQSQVILRSLCVYFVRQMEPKILRLVYRSSPPPALMLKRWWVGGGPCDFKVSPSPLDFEL